MNSFWSKITPLAAYRDLRQFLASRTRQDMLFAAISFAIVVALALGFFQDSRYTPAYKRPAIICVTSWRADRTDAEILAQQKIDQIKKKKDDAERARIEAAEREKYRKVDQALKRWGI